ncbi:hypothetical protein Back11_28860 [Paenibacillus baekrokdamisoli]|uniref:Uncharacterized protein n=1 Tax=Paenibacillus baekrokdamisoli TaxID=1712516 RepID=A0A3G9J704_9BACL|nr:response regulator [Paenibacillus baekrokdamisoli]MBB3071123.1 YesN/AraC family two-component response regulator [Paenibacillus baekrokdamisoli]BBH21541.1 hypothetical protein Back11_28860 [Paenibacillus baekrokdamisoli]
MYRIMIVEDEPPIVRYLKSIVESVTDRFMICSVAEDGMEALEKIEALRPDVILTDVRMPRMNGVEFVKHLRTEHPQLLTVVISGYQDFEYARESLKWGALDYLLKPVSPEQLKPLLDMLAVRLDGIYHERAATLLDQIIGNRSVEEQICQKYLNYEQFHVILARGGSLPARFFNMQLGFNELGGWAQLDLEELSRRHTGCKIWLQSGRDEFESFFIIAMDGNQRFHSKSMAEQLNAFVSKLRGYGTVVYSSKSISLTDLAGVTNRMIGVLNENCVLGRNQALDLEDMLSANRREMLVLEDTMENKLAFFISNRQVSYLKSELSKMFADWNIQQYTQISLEKILRQILQLVEKHTGYQTPKLSLDRERQLDEALFYANGYESLLKAILDMIVELMSALDIDQPTYKLNAGEILSRIEVYVHKNLAEPITLQSVCYLMDVSQTYLSRLFRKSKNLTFNEYVTYARIQEAKRLMAEHPEMLLKDVASIVGYKDSHYFSRIFKSVTGSSPSAYND